MEAPIGQRSRRDALARAGHWLATLPPRFALEQEDALAAAAERCAYSTTAVSRAFTARFLSSPQTGQPIPHIGAGGRVVTQKLLSPEVG